MPTLYHAPQSRSSTILIALEEMGVTDRVDIRGVTIPRADGTGGRDPANPHPEGKVPLLEHNGALVWERPAILTYLSELFPNAPAVCPPGHPQRGTFLSWLAYYGDVVEPVLILQAAGLTHDFITASLRGPAEVAVRLATTLADGRPYLLGSECSVADHLMVSPFTYLRDAAPEDQAVRAWIARVTGRPAFRAVMEREGIASAGSSDEAV